MDSTADSEAHSRPPTFVAVYVADGTRRRFAAGTKAGFAIDRINRSEAETSTRYSFITAVKEGEEAVEFGPDAELVSYGEGWTLQAVKDVKFAKSFGSSKVDAKDEMKAISQPIRKWYDISPPDLPQYRPLRDEQRPQINSSSHAFGYPKEFNPADYYPGGKLPSFAPPMNAWAFFLNISSVVVILGLGISFWVYLLEHQFFLRRESTYVLPKSSHLD